MADMTVEAYANEHEGEEAKDDPAGFEDKADGQQTNNIEVTNDKQVA